MTCDCDGEMLDRGVLGGLYWGQCERCGAWTHRPPEEDDFSGINLNLVDRSGDREGEPTDPQEDSDG